MTTDLQSRITVTRAALDDVEDDYREGATVLGEMVDALDRVENDADPVGQDDSVAALTGRVEETFADVERGLFDWQLGFVRTAFEAYDPDRFDALLADLREPFADLDAEIVGRKLDAAAAAYWQTRYLDPSEEIAAIRSAFEAGNRPKYEDAIDRLDAHFDDGHQDAVEKYTSSFPRLFGSTYESAAKSHVESLLQAFRADDGVAFETQADELETAFQNDHDAAVTDRIDALHDGLNDGDVSKIREQVQAFQSDLSDVQEIDDELTYRLNDDLASMVERYPNQTDAELPTLSDSLQPVVMLPVNVETRFSEVDAQNDCQLQIRVYPDDAHVDTHERGLTKAERREGRRFWERVWWAAHDVATSELVAELANRGEADLLEDVDLQSLPEAASDRHDAVVDRAWQALVERFDDRRAAWVKRTAAPPQGDDLLGGPMPTASIDAVNFSALGEDEPTLPAAWTRPPRAGLLPDRWVAIIDLGSEVRTVEGSPIQEPLPVGPSPDPTASDGSPSVSGAPEWTIDFEAAKEVGMGLETELDAFEANDGVDSIVVVGVKSSMTPNESAEALRDLLDAHHYTDGLAFLEQGTQTNNTDGGAAGGATVDAAALECGPSLAQPGTDGAKAARLLGLDPEQLGHGAGGPGAGGQNADHVFASVAGADGVEQRDARQFNTALWSATWGYYLPHMLGSEMAVGTDEGMDYRELMTWLRSYREHFVEYVRARGPLPALRVGDQPYGVLPTTTLANEHWEFLSLASGSSETGGSDDSFTPQRYPKKDVLGDLVTAVRALQLVWTDSSADVTVLDDVADGINAIEDLLDLLSLDATSVGYRTRLQVGRDVLLNAAANDAQLTSAIQSKLDVVEQSTGSDHLKNASGWQNPPSPRVATTLLWGDESPLIEPLVGEELSEFLDLLLSSPFGALSATQLGPAIREVEGQVFEDARERFDLLKREPASLLEALLYYATLQEYGSARARLGDQYEDGSPDIDHLFSGNVWHLLPEPETYSYVEEGIVERMNDLILPKLAEHPALGPEDTYAEALDRARDLDAESPAISPQLQSHTESLSYLKERDFDPETAERLLTETLDLASHRLDAWATSIATRRLDDVRTHQAETGDPGIYVGGWGYVTDVKKTDDPDSDGYLHAPSISHATTGAVLRNGSLAFEDGRAELLDLNLSPERVGRAMDVIEAIRAGHDLGTLLGYRFERQLREAENPPDLDQYVPEFRALAPPVAGKQDETDDGETPSEAGKRDVVDGLALYRQWKDETIPWGTSVDNSRPSRTLPDKESDGSPDDDPTDDTEAYTAIYFVLRELDETITAVKDLLTAESVHQLLQGRSMRTGASLDALARGEAPPEIDVVETPRSGTGVTHRMLVLFGDANPDAPATWPTNDRQVRADAEPNLDSWVAELLPDPSNVACACTYEVVSDDDDDPSFESGGYGITLADLDLSPLDLLSIVEGGTDAQRSELEQRVLYAVAREHDLPDGATIELTFKPVTEWEHSAAELDGLDSLDGLVSFGEVLAAVDPLSDLVSTGRAADARDLRTPASAGEPNYDATALRTRANLVVNALDGVDEDLTTLRTVLEDDESGRDDLLGFESVAEAVADLSPTDVTLSTLENDLDATPASSVRQEVESLHATLETGVISFATVDGDVKVESKPDQTIEGVVAAEQGTQLSVRVYKVGVFFFHQEVTVQQDGEFEAVFDFDHLSDGDEVEIAVHGPGGTVGTADGTVVATVDGTPSTDPDVGPVSVPTLEAFADTVRRLDSVGEAAAPLGSALGWTDLEALQAVESLVDWQATRQTSDWQAGWPVDVEQTVTGLLTLPPVALSGFGHPDLETGAWQDLVATIDAFVAGTDLLTYTPDERQELQDALASVVGHTDATVEDAIDAATSSATSTLQTIAGLRADAEDAADAFRLATLEAVRDALLRASHFGVGAAIPQAATGYDDEVTEELSRQAGGVATEVAARLASAPRASDAADPDADVELERIEAVFEESFTVLAPFSPTNATELGSALSASASETLQNDDPMAVETWFRRNSSVRDGPETLGRTFTSTEAIGSPAATFDAGQTGPRFRVGQLPYEVDEDDYEWVGLPGAWDDERPAGRLSLVTHGATAHGGTPAAGLFVDEWVETVPDEDETTGVAFQHDRPTNQPPQSILLAAPPNQQGWSLDALSDVVTETMELARARTVDPSTLKDLGHFLPALTYAQSVGDGADDPPTFSVDLTDLYGGN